MPTLNVPTHDSSLSHRVAKCYDDDSKQCHYIATATASAISAIAALQASESQFSQTERRHLDSIQALIASLDLPSDTPNDTPLFP